ncbi:MAG: hypothetical protein KDI55_26470, partial [Anaerolineae bacterium]|nr:hypothetical protein [Anaerolineae bacterium]
KNWGIRDYITRIEEGSYRITDSNGKTWGFARTMADARRKAYQLRQDAKANNDDPGQLQIDVNMNRFNPTAQRSADAKTQGEENIFDVLPRYTHAMYKRIVMRPLLAEYKRLKKENPKYFDKSANEILQSQINAIMGNEYTTGDRIADEIATAFGWEPGKYRDFVAGARFITANAKLGYRIVAGLVNRYSGHGMTWTKTGTEIYLKASRALKDGVYVDAHGTSYNIPDIIEQLEKENKLGMDLIIGEGGQISKKEPLWKPLSFFQRQERPIREHGFVANYILQREKYGLDHEGAMFHALQGLRFQQATYNLAALPEIMRSPGGRLVFQFKSYFANHIQFLTTLRNWEWARYLAVQFTLSGPRGFVLFLKSIPVLGAMGMLDDWEKWLTDDDNLSDGMARGIGGALGADVSAPATFQFPQTMDDWLGPAISDALKLGTDVLYPMIVAAERWAVGDKKDAPNYVLPNMIEWFGGVAPILKYWSEALNSTALAWDAVEEEGSIYEKAARSLNMPGVWLRDSRGNKAWQIGSVWDRILLASGALPIDKADNSLLTRLWEENMQVRRENRRRVVAEILDKLRSGDRITKDDAFDLKLYGVNPQSIPNTYKWQEMSPEARSTLRQGLLDKAEAADFFELTSPQSEGE